MTYTDVDRGAIGSKRASFRKRNFRDIALQILIANPDEDVENLANEFLERLSKDKDALESLAIYGLQNVKHSLTPIRGGMPRSAPQVMENQIIEEQATKITQKITANLMQFVMPNGKTLGQSTGAECEKVGGWFTAVGKRVGRSGIVGNKLTESDLQKIFKSRRK